jgi:hypothetical protein
LDNEYKELLQEISKQNIKESKKYYIRKYLLDNLIAILALVVAIIALFK